MGRRSPRSPAPFRDGARSDRDIVYGGQTWSYPALVGALALLTAPLWLLQPSPLLGSPDQSRLIGASAWAAVAALAAIAGRTWGHRLSLDPDRRTVSRELRGPWKTSILWTYPGERIESVSLRVHPDGIARLEASPRGGSPFLIESGTNAEDLRALGEELSRCWDVPFRD